jgi:hypothetical protein
MYNGTYDLEAYLRHVDRMDENENRSGCKVCGGDLMKQSDEFCSSFCVDDYDRDN